jgi:hypothetical protein
MKKLLTNPIAIIVTILFCGYIFHIQRSFFEVSNEPSTLNWSVSLPESDTAFNGLFYSPFLDDTLPHYEYARIADSLKQIKEQKELINRSFTTGFSFGIIGTSIIENELFFDISKKADSDLLCVSMMDTVNKIYEDRINMKQADSLLMREKEKLVEDIIWRYNLRKNKLTDSLSKSAEKKYYLALLGYKLDHDTKFFIQDGKHNLAYVVWDRVIKRTHDSTKIGHYERKEIPVRYSKEEEKILIPITKKQYTMATTLLKGFSWFVMALWAFVIFGIPLQIIVSISNGRAFTMKNISRLNMIALFLFMIALFASFSPFLFQLIFSKYIDPEFKNTSVGSSVYKNLQYYFLAAIVFVLSIAFKKGYKLQQEQDLTV